MTKNEIYKLGYVAFLISAPFITWFIQKNVPGNMWLRDYLLGVCL